MKKTTYLLGMLIAFQTISYAQCPAAGYTCIPDANFEQALITFGYDTEGVADGRILTSDAVAASGTLNFAGQSIGDLTGIDAFVNIDGLNVSYNPIITPVDLTSNTLLTTVNFEECNDLASLTLTNLSMLNSINIYGTNLVTLEVSTNTALTSLNARNASLTLLDLSSNVSLSSVDVKNNALLSLDVRNGNNAGIASFNSDSNSNLTCIFVDDAAAAAGYGWSIDAGSTFVETVPECATLSRARNSISQFSVYPNPATSQVTIVSKTDGHIEIFNITGKRLLTKELSVGNNALNVSDLASGVYLARISAEGKTETKKLIIK